MLKAHSSKQFLLTVEGLQALFTKATGLKVTRSEQTYNDGQTGQTKTHLDFIQYGPVTLSKPYDAVNDGAILDWAQQQAETAATFSMTITPVQADLAGSPIPGARTLTLADCQLASWTFPEVDREAGGLAMLVLDIIPGSIATA